MENQQAIEQKELLELAKKRVKKIKNFYSHLFVYVIGVTFFLLKMYSSIPFDFFPIRFINWFVMSIWTVIIGIQMIELFFAEIVFGKKWEDKKIQHIMTKEAEKKTWE